MKDGFTANEKEVIFMTLERLNSGLSVLAYALEREAETNKSNNLAKAAINAKNFSQQAHELIKSFDRY